MATMAPRVGPNRPADLPAADRQAENSTFFSILKKVAILAASLFVSLISFSLIPPEAAFVFSAVVLLSALGYMIGGGGTPIVPVVGAPVYVPPPVYYQPWYRFFTTTYWRTTRPVYVPPAGGGVHAPVGTGQVTAPVFVQPAHPHVVAAGHAPARGAPIVAPAAGSPLNRVARPSDLTFFPPPGGDGTHAQVGRR